jgi:hypothetical protein
LWGVALRDTYAHQAQSPQIPILTVEIGLSIRAAATRYVLVDSTVLQALRHLFRVRTVIISRIQVVPMNQVASFALLDLSVKLVRSTQHHAHRENIVPTAISPNCVILAPIKKYLASSTHHVPIVLLDTGANHSAFLR